MWAGRQPAVLLTDDCASRPSPADSPALWIDAWESLYDDPVASPLPVPPGLQRGAHDTREEWVESGLFSVDLLCRELGRKDLAGVDLLDVGCGTKIVKTLLDNSMRIGRYVGIDVSSEVIDWLQANVSDPRFEFHRLDAHNAMYNPEGTDLASFKLLPVGGRYFDLICLFSVFTHLAPHDYVAMLRLVRRHAKPDARLLFSLFLRESAGEEQFAQAVEARLASADPEVRRRTEAAIGRLLERRAAQDDSRFIDEVPDHPLQIARYESGYALELVDGTGWKVLELHPPERFIQHYMICAPI
jgi:SAM-dependent methyltransferase